VKNFYHICNILLGN